MNTETAPGGRRPLDQAHRPGPQVRLYIKVIGKGRYSPSWGEPHFRATGRHLPYGITQCYLPPDTSERAPPNPSHAVWYSSLMGALGHTLTPFCSVCRQFFGFIPGDVHVLQISSDDVHPIFPWLSRLSLVASQLPLYRLTRYPGFFHSQYVSQPPQSSFFNDELGLKRRKDLKD